MTGKHGRLFKASAVLGAAGTSVALGAAPAAATDTPFVRPTTGLHDAQSVSVSWNGFANLLTVAAVECSGPVPAGPLTSVPNQCDTSTAATLSLVSGTIADFSGNLVVRKALNPPSGAVTCTNQCSILVIANLNGIGTSTG